MTEYKLSLKAARANANLTQGDVARLLHRTKQTIVHWESEPSCIKYADLIRLCEIYDCPPEFIRLS